MKLKSFAMASAVAMSLAFLSRTAYATTVNATIDFTGANGSNSDPWLEDDFSFDPARPVKGNCESNASKPCAALNDNETSELTRVGGGNGNTFSLVSFWFQLLGNGTDNKLTVLATFADNTTTSFELTQALYPNNNGGRVFSGFPLTLTNLISVIFGTAADGGNVRIDDIKVAYECDPEDPNCGGGGNTPVPVPGALPLLATGLAGLGYMARRRRNA